ncbi:hypothetical protein Bca52824_003070 [Brassica carinata]|uniref:FBD domain-containing protein n=1 Tax=Brassica carinata TaxID=52824 RepID=A0A8X7WN91_BRACI|nr:hypothetical protein Bca52824_003070 [Brassica carinata]
MCWCKWNFSSVSVPTLKRLTFCWEARDENPESVSIDTPNLVYLEFTDTISDVYPKLNFDSLVEARICLRMSEDQIGKAQFLEEASFSDLQIHYAEGNEENEMVGNAIDFIVGICNVQILYLYADTLEVLTYCCEAVPVFNNLRELTIESNPKIGWDSLPGLLKNAPNLEILVFQGLVHKATDRCGDMCLCETYEEEEEDEDDEIPSCLLSSRVKVIKILKFGDYYGNMGKQSEQIKYFLETMPNLEQMILSYNAPTDEHVTEFSRQLERMV